MSTKISVNQFQKRLTEEVKEVAEEQGWNFDNNTQRGYAFQLWVAKRIAEYELNYETDPEEALLKSKDLKADVVFDDPASKHLLICQCKFDKFRSSVDETEVNDFFGRHKMFMDRKWVLQHGSREAKVALKDYAERVNNGYRVTLYFMSTAQASERTSSIATKWNDEYHNAGVPVTCEFFDFSRLKDYYTRSLSVEESIPESVEIDLPSDQFFWKEKPYPTIVAVIKGNTLRNLSNTYKQGLYAWNIRGYLGNRGINEGIRRTAESDSENFFYFNNGVSAICTELELDGNRVYAKKFQIINGAQTVSTLADLPADSKVEVLFRLAQTQSVSTEKGFNRNIIQFNNSQNAVKISDFRSNDPIQFFLEKNFQQVKSHRAIPRFHYIRKRSVGRKGEGYGLRLEELAKIRYSFLYDPTLVHASPKDLWTPVEEKGVYERAFGVNGELADVWGDDVTAEALLAVAYYFRITDEAKRLAKCEGEEALTFLPRLRFHALALLGLDYRRKDSDSAQKLLRSEGVFDSKWSVVWPTIKTILVDVYTTAEEEGQGMFAFVRSGERWERMKKRFSRMRVGE
jgi:hypothetical protein